MKAAINSLNGGVITPLMRGRGDLESLRRAAVQMANFMPRVFGGAGRRPSLMHVAESLDGDKHSRLIPFTFSVTTRYFIELGHESMRFWDAGTVALDGDTIAAPWDESDLDEIQYAQINDVMFLTHPDYHPQELLRTSSGWELRPVPWKYPPLRDENAKEANRVNPVYSDLFRVGTFEWEEWDLSGSYDFEVAWTGAGSSTKTARLQRLDAGVWTTVKTYSTTAATYLQIYPFVTSGTQRFRMTYTGPICGGGILIYNAGSVFLKVLNLPLTQPYTQTAVTVPADTPWRVQMDATASASLPAGASCVLEKYTSSWVSVQALTITPGIETVYVGSVSGSAVQYRLNWAGNQMDDGEMAIQTIEFTGESEITLECNATSGLAKTLTASEPLFDPLHIGAYFEIVHRRELASSIIVGVVGAITDTQSTPVLVSGQWDFYTYGSWSGTIYVERQNADGSWTTERSWVGNKDRNISSSGIVDSGTYMRLRISGGNGSAVSGGAAVPRFVLEAADARHVGLVQVTAYTDSENVTVDVVNNLHATTATNLWSEGAWSDYRGYPRAVTLHDQRLIFAGSPSEPQKIWGSVIGDFRNFELGTFDDAGFAFQLAATEANPILWLVSKEGILAGTQGEVWSLSADGTITPSNVNVNLQSALGSEPIQVLRTESAILLVERGGTKIREFVFDFATQSYQSPVVTQLIEHLLRSGIRAMARTANPEQTLWVVTNDGLLLSCSYRREEEVIAWAQHPTTGTVESVSTNYGAAADEVWIVVDRDGTRRVERLDVEHWTRVEAESSWHVDAGVRVTGDQMLSISGLDHLEGLTVSVWADGAERPQRVVNDGEIPLASPADEVVVGLPMESILQPWPVFMPLDDGTSQTRKQRISKIIVLLHRSGACEFADSPDATFYPLPIRSASDPEGAVVLRSDYFETPVQGAYSWETGVTFKSSSVLPLTILAVVYNMGVYGE